MKPQELKVGDIVRLSAACRNRNFAGRLMAITESKKWGAQGSVSVMRDGKPDGLAFYRATWEEMESMDGTEPPA